MYHSLVQLLSAAKLMARAQGATLRELEEKLGVSRRSVFRALQALDELGYPYWNDREHGNRYRLVQGTSAPSWWVPLPAVQFSFQDKVVLDYLFSTASRVPGLEQDLSELRHKLAVVGAATGYALEPKADGAGPRPGSPARLLDQRMPAKAMPAGIRDTIITMLKAMHDSVACVVSYDSREAGRTKKFRIHPLAVFEADGGVYGFVEVPRFGSIRMLALERVRTLTPLDEKFTMPAGFDAQALLDDPFGLVLGDGLSVRLRFIPTQAPYISERDWPEGYRLEPNQDGSLTMAFATRGLFALKRWILSQGSSVVVEEPAWLATEIANEARAVLEAYKNC